MNLLFLRHGIAVARDDPRGPESDAERALTEEGRKKMGESARGMRALGIGFDRIVSSPLVRARETAEIVAAEYGKKAPKVELIDVLAPGMTVEALLSHFEKEPAPDDATLLLVGHEPDFGRAVGQLAFGALSDRFSLKKGGLAWVELSSTSPNARGRLLCLLTPKLMGAAAGGKK